MFLHLSVILFRVGSLSRGGLCLGGLCPWRSLSGGSLSREIPDRDPPTTTAMWLRVGSTHPTGMHSCLLYISFSEGHKIIMRCYKMQIFSCLKLILHVMVTSVTAVAGNSEVSKVQLWHSLILALLVILSPAKLSHWLQLTV